MMSHTAVSWRFHRARVGALSRGRTPDDPELRAARRDLASSRLEEHVRRVMNGEDPPSTEQRVRIAALLIPQ